VGGGRWFVDNVGWEVGDGAHTLFWWDPWIDELVLKNSFGRLFDLSNNKMATVTKMYSLGWGEEGEAWKWRRRLFAWEEEKVRECCDILTNIVLQLIILTGGFGTYMLPAIITSQVLITIC